MRRRRCAKMGYVLVGKGDMLYQVTMQYPYEHKVIFHISIFVFRDNYLLNTYLGMYVIDMPLVYL